MARWLGTVIDDDSIHEAVVEKLRTYLDGLDINQASASDQATALSHELSALGVWGKINEQLLIKGLSTAAPSKMKVLLSAAPLALEERLLEAGKSKPKSKRRRQYLIEKRKGPRKLGSRGNMRFFTVTFESRRVAASLRTHGVSLSLEEKSALCRLLDKKSKMYVKGYAWSVAVTQQVGKSGFTLGELTAATSNTMGVIIGPRVGHMKVKHGVKVGIVGQNIWSPKATPTVLPLVKPTKSSDY